MTFVSPLTHYQFSSLDALILLSSIKTFGPATYWKLQELGWQADDVLRGADVRRPGQGDHVS